ncbi:MAG TPA: MBL fold metallo-hydrolase [Clostridia bacterium]|nr:MBL fold metallo-hydrolase [Clostridia bacterium]
MQTVRIIDLGGVNCYLLKAGNSFVLIDTGFAFRRNKLRKELENAGCKPGNLVLAVVTHGDSDHTGNCAYLGRHYGAKIAMHREDSGMVEKGDMLWNRKMRGTLERMFLSLPFLRLNRKDRFKPDIYLEDEQELSMYGLEAKVVHIPGHSAGSIGILTGDGLLFCGDLLGNNRKPGLFSIIDDMETAQSSVDRLRALNIDKVFPGHGKPFSMKELQ